MERVGGAVGLGGGHPVGYLREQSRVAGFLRVRSLLGLHTAGVVPGLVLVVVVVVGCLLRCG